MKPIKTEKWQDALKNLIKDPKELIELLQIDSCYLPAAYRAAELFPLRVTHSFASRMQKGNVNDPLLMQVLPLALEEDEVPGYIEDPLGESAANPVPGLLHKYSSRVLVTLTSACAIHCRYCFRRHFPYAENNPGRSRWSQLFSYIRDDAHINEVILSGGDPLSASDSLLQAFTDELSQLSQIKRLRLHTRLPIVLPERVSDDFIDWISSLPFQVIIVVHANHANEIDADVKAALKKLSAAGVTLLNQSVLLKGVNDHIDTLVELSEALFDAGVLPYYLHVLDKVKGTAHFDLPVGRAQQLHQAMLARLPGYLVPKFACEEAGALSKTLLYP